MRVERRWLRDSRRGVLHGEEGGSVCGVVFGFADVDGRQWEWRARTVADALTQTAIESIACGTPCVAFDRGGVTDVVTEETGYQARFGDVDDLAHGLKVVLEDHDRYADRCREIAEQEFTVDLQVQRYVELYEQVLAA